MTSQLSSWKPWPYQERAIKLMLSQAAVGLFLDPGMGKTSTVLAAFKILKSQGLCDSMLVVAPLRAIYTTWPNEIMKWSNFIGLRCSIIHGPRKLEALKEDADIYLINPEGVPWLFTDARMADLSADVLCIDESTKFKNSQSKRFKALRRWIDTFSRRWILTGTPTPNGIEDLFAQTFILDGGNALGKYITHFRTKYMYQTGYGGYEWKPLEGSFDQIMDRVAPLVIRMKAVDYLDMPDLLEVDVKVQLPKDIMKAYKDVEEEFIYALENDLVVAANAAAAGTKCRQIANGAVFVEDDRWVAMHDSKIEAVADLLEELGEDSPILLLYEFTHDKERLMARFPCHTLDRDFAQTVKDWNSGRIRILLGHPASMGHALNLQEGGAQHVVWFGVTWNLEHYIQANQRLWRQGQTGTVVVHRILAEGTADERVARVLKAKEATQDEVNNAIIARRDPG